MERHEPPTAPVSRDRFWAMVRQYVEAIEQTTGYGALTIKIHGQTRLLEVATKRKLEIDRA